MAQPDDLSDIDIWMSMLIIYISKSKKYSTAMCYVSGCQNLKKSAAFLSKISFQDFPPLIGSAFAFVAELDGIFSQIDFGYIPVCKTGRNPASMAAQTKG